MTNGDPAMTARWKRRSRSAQVWRGQDDPDFVAVAEVFESREAANAALSDPGLPDEMAADGVDVSSVRVELLDDAGHIER